MKQLVACSFHLLFFLSLFSFQIFTGGEAQAQLAFGPSSQVSISSSGLLANAQSSSCSLSSEGNLIVFNSMASNLGANAVPGVRQILLRNATTGTTQTISTSSVSPAQLGNAESNSASITNSGTYVTFQSAASNLVANDTNAGIDIFVWQRSNNSLSRVNTSSTNAQGNGNSIAPSISDDGRYVVFLSSATNLLSTIDDSISDLYLKDRQTSEIKKITDGNAASWAGKPAISGDGRYVVFGSFASNLVTGDSNNRGDVFLYDRIANTIQLIGLPPSGQTFSQQDSPVALGPGSISINGRFIAFGIDSDSDGYSDQLYLRDTQTSSTLRLSQTLAGQIGNSRSEFPRMSGDGSKIIFYSAASNLLPNAPQGGVFLFDRGLNHLQLIDDADGHEPCISANAQVIGFQQVIAATGDQVFRRLAVPKVPLNFRVR